VRRRAEHRGALGRRRVAGADRRRDTRSLEAQFARNASNRRARFGQILVDVRAQRLQRRYVEDANFVGQARAEAFLEQVVERDEKRGKRLAGTGGRRDQGVGSCGGSPPILEAEPSVGSPSVSANQR
jgi:hypothetical protein